MPFERHFQAGWGDMDGNAHMRNTTFLDLSATVRMMYFAECGFTPQEFARHRLGPVVRRDDVEYFREFRLLEDVRITLLVAAMSDDGSRFAIRNEFFKSDGRLAARVTSSGGWLNLESRKLAVPPAAIAEALRGLERTTDFVTLESTVAAR
jgi:acyl-CoA thioester hydrolase